MDNELISVIIPVYKVEAYIEECVSSVLKQTYPHLEIILVDDCGGDRSIELAQNILEKQHRPWTILRHDQNRGQGAARNTGVAAMKGSYIYFLDSDDYIAAETLEILHKALKAHHANMAFGQGYVYRHSDGSITPVQKDTAANLHTINPFHAYLRADTNPGPCHRLIEKTAYDSTGIKFREDVVLEDFIWSFYLSRTNLKICTAEGKNLYFYRQWDGSTTAQPESEGKHWQGNMALFRLFYQYLVKEKLYEDAVYCQRYAELFHRMIYVMMTGKGRSRRQRCKQIKEFLDEFSFCIPNIRKTFNHMKLYTKLSRFMPTFVAYRLATLLLSCFNNSN